MAERSGERQMPWLVAGIGMVGLALIVISAAGFLIGFDTGRLFAIGIVMMFSCALYEGFLAKRWDIEGIITVGIGLAFFSWLLLK